MYQHNTLHFSFSLFVLFALASLGLAIVDKWTPETFNWTALEVGPRESWKGLYLSSETSIASTLTQGIAELTDVRTTQDGVSTLAAPWLLGLAWHSLDLVLTGSGLWSTINTCKQNKGQADNIYLCVSGLVTTILGIGGEAAAAKRFAESRGYLGVARNAWLQSGLEQIDLREFTRDIDGLDAAMNMTSQKAHNHFVHKAIRGLSVGGDDAVEFIGYAPESHKLARRSSTIHPLAPMFRFTHHRHGPMQLTSRDTGENGMHFTISYGDHPTHHASQEKRDEFFRHERLDENLMEARFDSEAAAADPGDITFNGAEAFDQIEKQVECFTGDGWNEGNVLSVQMYDQANQATFGYGSVGIFPDNGVDSALEDFTPRDMPLTGGQDC